MLDLSKKKKNPTVNCLNVDGALSWGRIKTSMETTEDTETEGYYFLPRTLSGCVFPACRQAGVSSVVIS